MPFCPIPKNPLTDIERKLHLSRHPLNYDKTINSPSPFGDTRSRKRFGNRFLDDTNLLARLQVFFATVRVADIVPTGEMAAEWPIQ